jgi:hypothetical protein
MTTHLLSPPTTRSTSPATGASLWRSGLVAGLIAALATTAIAAVAGALGVSFEVDGEAVPLVGFAQMTLIGAVVGIVLATALRRWSGSPRTTFVRTTLALTVLSIVPDLTMGFDAASALALVLTHLAAAAIVIPRLAAPLPGRAPRQGGPTRSCVDSRRR